MRAPPLLFGYQIFAALVPRELCLQLRGRDDLATALTGLRRRGISLAFVFSLLSLYLVSLDTRQGFSKQTAMALGFSHILVSLSFCVTLHSQPPWNMAKGFNLSVE